MTRVPRGSANADIKLDQVPMPATHNSSNTSFAPARTAQENSARTVAALRSVWVDQQTRVAERLDTIGRAITAIATDNLDTELGHSATRAAHMLAGSLGMFGFAGASAAARGLETELAQPCSERAPLLSALLQTIRSDLRGEVSLAQHAVSQS